MVKSMWMRLIYITKKPTINIYFYIVYRFFVDILLTIFRYLKSYNPSYARSKFFSRLRKNKNIRSCGSMPQIMAVGMISRYGV